jgi:hypothetical protein
MAARCIARKQQPHEVIGDANTEEYNNYMEICKRSTSIVEYLINFASIKSMVANFINLNIGYLIHVLDRYE